MQAAETSHPTAAGATGPHLTSAASERAADPVPSSGLDPELGAESEDTARLLPNALSGGADGQSLASAASATAKKPAISSGAWICLLCTGITVCIFFIVGFTAIGEALLQHSKPARGYMLAVFVCIVALPLTSQRCSTGVLFGLLLAGRC
jgi:hypothetical protein